MNKQRRKIVLILGFIAIVISSIIYAVLDKDTVYAAGGSPTPITSTVIKEYVYEDAKDGSGRADAVTYKELDAFPIDVSSLRKQERFCATRGAAYGEHKNRATTIGWHTIHGHIVWHYFSYNTPNERTWKHYDAGLGAYVDDYYMYHGNSDYDPWDPSRFPALLGLKGGSLIVNTQEYADGLAHKYPDYMEYSTSHGCEKDIDYTVKTNWYYSGPTTKSLEWTCDVRNPGSLFNDGTMAFLLACYKYPTARSYTSDPLQMALWAWLGQAREDEVSAELRSAAKQFTDYFKASHDNPNVDVTPGSSAGSVYSDDEKQVIVGPFTMSDYVEARDYTITGSTTLQTKFTEFGTKEGSGEEYLGSVIKGEAILANEAGETKTVEFTVVNQDKTSGYENKGVPASSAQFYISLNASDVKGFDEVKDLLFTYQKIHASGSSMSYSGNQFIVHFESIDEEQSTCTYDCQVCRHTGLSFSERSDAGVNHQYWCKEYLSEQYCSHGQKKGVVWYSSVPSGCSAEWNCGKVEHTHSAACCSIEEHTHGSGCNSDNCDLSEHTHKSATYAYTGSWTKVSGDDGACNKTYTGAGPNKPDDVKCSKTEHTHGKSCCSKTEHTHGTGCNTASCSVGYEHTHKIGSCGKKHTCTCNYCVHGYLEGKHPGKTCTGDTLCPSHSHYTCYKFNWRYKTSGGSVQTGLSAGAVLSTEQVKYDIRVDVPISVELVINKYIDNIMHSGEAISTFTGGESSRKPKTMDEKKQDPLKAEVGDIITYKLEIDNNGRFDAQAKLKDTLPANADVYEMSSSDGVAHTLLGMSGSKTQTPGWITIPAKGKVTIVLKLRPTNSASLDTIYENLLEYVTGNHKTEKVRYIEWGESATHGSHSYGPMINTYEKTKDKDADYYKLKAYNVTVEKYIYDVIHNGTGSDNTKAADDSRKGVAEATKQANPVPIEVGDTVIYRIVLYNTTNSGREPVNNANDPYFGVDKVYVDLEDVLPNGYYNPSVRTSGLASSVADGKLNILAVMVPKNGSTTIEIQVTAKRTGCNNVEENKVNIKNVRNINRSPAGGVDDKYCLVSGGATDFNKAKAESRTSSDWYKFKHYYVTIRKYIYDVEHQHDEVTSALDNTYGPSVERRPLAETTKNGNPVYVEYGDKVTYKIQINNTVSPEATWASSPYYKPDDIYVDILDTLPVKCSNVTLEGVEVTPDSNRRIQATEVHVGPNSSVEITVTLTVDEHVKATVIENKAKIVRIQNINKCEDAERCEVYKAGATTDDTLKYNDATYVVSSDWYKLNDYKVMVDKYLYKYDEKMLKRNNTGFATNEKGQYTSEQSIIGAENILNESRKDMTKDQKQAAPLSVEKTETVVYQIEVRNNAETVAGGIASNVKPATQYRSNIFTELLEEGVTYKSVTAKIYDSSNNIVQDNIPVTVSGPTNVTDETRSMKKYEFRIPKKYVIDPGQHLSFFVVAEITKTNMYLRDLMNKGKITELGNINTATTLAGEHGDVKVIENSSYDENIATEEEERSYDFVRLKDLVISGRVWVDLNRDGYLNDQNANPTAEEQALYGMNSKAMKKNLTVKLYVRSDSENPTPIRTTKTDDNGFFTFARDENYNYYQTQYTYNHSGTTNYNSGTMYQRVDKANNKDGNGNYQSSSKYIDYYIEYEYDGVTFRSTVYSGTNNLNADGSYKPNYEIDSNADEFKKRRDEFDETYEYISYNSTYGSVTGGPQTSILEYEKTDHISQLYERKDVRIDSPETRPMVARSFIYPFDSATIKSYIRTAMNSCGAAQWKQCSNHWKHWEGVISLGIINPDEYPDTKAGRIAAQNYLKSRYNELGNEDVDLTHYLWLYKYDSTYSSNKPETEYLKDINFGLALKENIDISLSKDVYSVKARINGEEMEYIANENDGINGENQLSNDFMIDKSYAVRLYESDYQYRVDQYISEAVRQYKGTQGESELNIEVTYRIRLENKAVRDDDKASSTKNRKLSVKVHEILDLYDQNFKEFNGDPNATITVKEKQNGYLVDKPIKVVEAWYGSADESNRTPLTVTTESRFAQKENNFKADGYNTLYITTQDPTGGIEVREPELGSRSYVDVYIKYVLDKEKLEVKVTNPDYGAATTELERSLKLAERALNKLNPRGTENIAQIHAYSIWYQDTNTPASIVDMDSNAGNIGDTNGKSTTSTTKTSADDDDYYEDITYKTGVDIRAESSENDDTSPVPVKNEESEVLRRFMNGVTWDDAKSTTVGSGNETQYIGNGTFNSSDTALGYAKQNESAKKFVNNDEKKDKLIGGVKAEYIELVKMPGDTAGTSKYYEQILQNVTWQYKQNDRTAVNNGRYELKGFVPGDYIVRFSYGDKYIDKTSDLGKSVLVYNGQDYKSTQYNPERDNITGVDEVIADITRPNVSDARDDEMRRLEVNSYSEIMYNSKAEILKGLGSNADVDGTEEENSVDDLKTLVEVTDMNAETATFTAKVERVTYNTNSVPYNKSVRDGATNGRRYFFENIDLGLEYRPESEATLEMAIEEIKVVTSDKNILIDLFIETEYDDTSLTTPIYHRINKNKSIGTEYIQFISNTYQKDIYDLTTEDIQGLVHLQVDSEVLQGCTVIITYKLIAENTSEIDRIATNLNSIRYLNNRATQTLIYNNLGNVVYEFDKDTGKVTSTLPELIDAKAYQNAILYSASKTARNALFAEYYAKDELGDGSGDGIGIVYRTKEKKYGSGADDGYFGRYVGHAYYAGNTVDYSEIEAVDTIEELKVSKIVDYVDTNIEYVADNFETTENRLWTVINTAEKERELATHILKVRENLKSAAPLARALKNDKGIAYQKLVESFDDRTIDAGEDRAKDILVQNASLSRFLQTKRLGSTDRDDFSGYIYLPLSKVVSAESKDNELQFENIAEITEYITLNGRRTNFVYTVGNIDTSGESNDERIPALNAKNILRKALQPTNGRKGFIAAALETDSAATEGTFLIPPTGLDLNRRTVVNAVEKAKVGIPVTGIVVLAVIGGIALTRFAIYKYKKRRIK